MLAVLTSKELKHSSNDLYSSSSSSSGGGSSGGGSSGGGGCQESPSPFRRTATSSTAR
jgi:hypothetical protein